jgi:hypothetical protein
MAAPFVDGKLTETVKTHLPEHTADLFRARARLAGADVSELLRDVVCMLEHGATYGECVASLRRRTLAAFGPAQGQGGAE